MTWPKPPNWDEDDGALDTRYPDPAWSAALKRSFYRHAGDCPGCEECWAVCEACGVLFAYDEPPVPACCSDQCEEELNDANDD